MLLIFCGHINNILKCRADKNGLISDTEPSDIELDLICDSFQKNIINITTENWSESIKYIKHMNNSEAQHIVHSIVNFELNSYINNQNEFKSKISEELEVSEELENSNLIKINNYNKFKRII